MKTYFLPILAFVAFALFSCNTETPTKEVVIETIETIEEPIIEILEPVTWDYTTEKVGEGEYMITFNAEIQDGWYVYSTTVDEDGPIPTSIFFDENEALGELHSVTESGDVTKEGYDEMFDMDIKKFGHAATFSQMLHVSAPATITGYLEYMTCDSMQCLFPDPIEFVLEAN